MGKVRCTMEIMKVVLIGIILVFLILLLLTFILLLFPKLAGGKSGKVSEKKPEHSELPQEPQNLSQPESREDLALICVLTAAVAAYRAGEGKTADTSRFRVVAFRKTPCKR